MRVIVIGGGAAGFFGAIACAEAAPQAHVTLLEAALEPLGKVRIRAEAAAMSRITALIRHCSCNITHGGARRYGEPLPDFSRAIRWPGISAEVCGSKLRRMAACFRPQMTRPPLWTA